MNDFHSPMPRYKKGSYKGVEGVKIKTLFGRGDEKFIRKYYNIIFKKTFDRYEGAKLITYKHRDSITANSIEDITTPTIGDTGAYVFVPFMDNRMK